MRGFLAFILAAALATTAAAQSYRDVVRKQQRCELEGEMWRESFEKDTVFGKPLKQHSAEHQAGSIEDKVFQTILMVFISAPHKEKFRTPKDAYMAGWAECMDRTK